MKNYKNIDIHRAILIEESDLRSFVDFLNRNFDKVSFKGKTHDGTLMDFVSCDDLLEYPNFDKRHIIYLKISCDSQDCRLVLTFDGDRDLRIIRPNSVNYNLEYDNPQRGFVFEDELKERLKVFRPWYNFLTYIALTWGFAIILGLVGILVLAIDYFIKELWHIGFLDIDYNNVTIGPSLLGYIWLIPILGIGYLLDKVRDYLFPLFFMSTGMRVKEFAKRKKISYVFFGVIGLGIAINLMTSLLIN